MILLTLRLEKITEHPNFFHAYIASPLLSGVLGIMYLDGAGIAKSEANAYECLKQAANRGNVYAQGRLVELFYKKRLFTKASDLARR